MTVALQRLGKHSPGVTLSTTEGHPLLGNRPINTHFKTREKKDSPWGPCRRIIRGHRRRLAGGYRSTTESERQRIDEVQKSTTELACEKKTLCSSYSENVIYPLPGYD
jgi:hypothetical protein